MRLVDIDGKPNRMQFSHALETMLVWEMGLVSACLGSLSEVVVQKKEVGFLNPELFSSSFFISLFLIYFAIVCFLFLFPAFAFGFAYF